MLCEILEPIDGRSREASVGFTAFEVAPSAARLTGSLRDIGYEFTTAVADIVDNSVAAGARNVSVEIEFDGPDSRVWIVDDGAGMTPAALTEALRYGTRRRYAPRELGRYGLGLKTASLSQCRCVTVVSRSTGSARRAVRMLDLDLVEEWDDWVVVDPGRDEDVERARSMLADGPGTVVLWRDLDRVLPDKRPEGGWARRRLATQGARTAEHLAMVFHRFLEGAAGDGLTITVNGEKVEPWDPFAPNEPATYELPLQKFEVVAGDAVGTVGLRRFVLPSRDRFNDPEGFDRLSGPLKWNRQQGLYVYRADRLVQWGGWAGVRAIDEHTKLARAALDFDTDLDGAFNIDVAKMRVILPPQLRQMLEQPLNELCIRADAAYRKTSRNGSTAISELSPPTQRKAEPAAAADSKGAAAGLALRSAAMQAGEYEAFQRITAALRRHAPDVAESLGLNA
jgi:hypothetical protein